jgi:nitrogen fixation protein NifX
MRHLRLVTSIEEMPPMTVRIAFATSDRKQVDQHFGAAEAFAIYELGDGDARLVELAQFTDSDVAMDGHEGKLASKIALLEGCAAAYCNAVGASAVKQLLAVGIQPMKVEEGASIDDLLGGLSASMAGEPPAWMVKHMKQPGDAKGGGVDRFAAMDAEGWSE